MRGKCATCEFYDDERASITRGWGECHIRAAEKWPRHEKADWCGEYRSNAPRMEGQAYQPPEVHTGTRVEKSMGETS